MKKYNNWFNELWDLDKRLKPWQSILIAITYIALAVSTVIYLYLTRN